MRVTGRRSAAFPCFAKCEPLTALELGPDDYSAPETVATVPNDTSGLLKRLKKLAVGGKVKCCYEAGPTAFGLQRALQAAGVECVVIAPSMVPRTSGDRVKGVGDPWPDGRAQPAREVDR